MGEGVEVKRIVRRRTERKYYIDTDTGRIKPEVEPGRDLAIREAQTERSSPALQAPEWVID
jgi:hypothetical protein